MPPSNRPQLIDPADDPRLKFTTSGLGLVIQGDVSGMAVALEQHVDATADRQTIGEMLDDMRYQFLRLRAQDQLGEKVLALQIAHDIVNRADEQKAAARKGYAMKKAHELASYEAAYAQSGKRAPFRLTGQQQKCLQGFDQQIQSVEPRVDEQVKNAQEEIPRLAKMIARLKAFIAGETLEMPHDGPDAELDEGPLAQAAE